MTSPAHQSGTDRIAEVAKSIESEIIVNVQGDEPEIEPETIDALIERHLSDSRSAYNRCQGERDAATLSSLSPH